MSARLIKELIEDYDSINLELDTAKQRLSKAEDEELKSDWEEVIQILEFEQYFIAISIKRHNPSKYMMKKYPIIDSIFMNEGLEDKYENRNTTK